MKKKIVIIGIVIAVVMAGGITLLVGKNNASKLDKRIAKIENADYSKITQIEKIRKDYNSAMPFTKMFVENLSKLEKIESRLKGDKEKVSKVEKMIDKIEFDKTKEKF